MSQRMPIRADELLALLDRLIPQTDEAGAVRLTDTRNWIANPVVRQAVFDERDRIATVPFPTPAGDLLPGEVYDLTLTDPWGNKATNHKGVAIGANPGHTLTKDYDFIPASKGSQRFELRANRVTKIERVRTGLSVTGR